LTFNSYPNILILDTAIFEMLDFLELRISAQDRKMIGITVERNATYLAKNEINASKKLESDYMFLNEEEVQWYKRELK